MHFKAEEIYFMIEFFLFIYVKIAIFIFALNVSFLNDFNDKFARLTFNINKTTKKNNVKIKYLIIICID